jgi:beta-glucosidase-like glycosyl hydrolase
VKHIADAPPTMSAQEMGASRHPRATGETQGMATGRYLLQVGINLDFAPVCDIPTTSNNFLGERAFGHSTLPVVEGATGFAIGLARAHVAASAKHFPGLGAAGPRDTDSEIVTITDDLEVPAVERFPEAPVRAVLAGEDILMFAQEERSSEDAYLMLRTAVRNGTIPRTLVLAAADRVDSPKRTLAIGYSRRRSRPTRNRPPSADHARRGLLLHSAHGHHVPQLGAVPVGGAVSSPGASSFGPAAS